MKGEPLQRTVVEVFRYLESMDDTWGFQEFPDFHRFKGKFSSLVPLKIHLVTHCSETLLNISLDTSLTLQALKLF